MNYSKACFTCKQIKSTSDFNLRKSRKDGFDSNCRECANAKKRKWNFDNKESVSEMNRRSYLKNPDLYKQSAKTWHSKNRDKSYKNSRAYLAKHPGLANSYQSKRRAKMKENGVFEIRNSFLKRLYLSPCIYCGTRKKIDMDHVLPIALGGRHSEGNLVPACFSCNRSKHDDFLIIWKLKR